MWTESMGELLAAAVAFVGSHVLLSSRPVRNRAVGWLGEKRFTIVYSLVALGTLVWMLTSYGRAPYAHLWSAPRALYWLPATVMPFSFLLFVGAMNPAARSAKGTGIQAITRHPMLWAFTLWALSHLAPNGDTATVILCSTFVALSLVGMVHIDARTARNHPERYERLAARTSRLPFAAVLGGRTTLRLRDIGWVPFVGAAILYVATWFLHDWAFGAPPHP